MGEGWNRGDGDMSQRRTGRRTQFETAVLRTLLRLCFHTARRAVPIARSYFHHRCVTLYFLVLGTSYRLDS